MASKLAMLSKLTDFKELASGLTGGGEDKKEPPSQKELKDEEKRKLAQQQAEEERRKRHQKEEYQREKVRENIRQKYGIQKKDSKEGKKEVVEAVAEDYGLSEEDRRQLQLKIRQDEELRNESMRKIDKKLETRRKKKEIKEKCQVQ